MATMRQSMDYTIGQITLQQATIQVTNGKTQLKDISKMLTPVLSKFILPLNLWLTMSGTDNTISFCNVYVFQRQEVDRNHRG